MPRRSSVVLHSAALEEKKKRAQTINPRLCQTPGPNLFYQESADTLMRIFINYRIQQLLFPKRLWKLVSTCCSEVFNPCTSLGSLSLPGTRVGVSHTDPFISEFLMANIGQNTLTTTSMCKWTHLHPLKFCIVTTKIPVSRRLLQRRYHVTPPVSTEQSILDN